MKILTSKTQESYSVFNHCFSHPLQKTIYLRLWPTAKSSTSLECTTTEKVGTEKVTIYMLFVKNFCYAVSPSLNITLCHKVESLA